jgi:hypothetical protein
MIMKKLNAVSALALSVTFVMAASPAVAGGLFGEGGLIRGDVGNFFDETIQEPILTPIVQGAVVAGGAAAGAAAGQWVGVPGPFGAMVGGQIGQGINVWAAGGHGSRAPQVQFGYFCRTNQGDFGPGPMNPLGSPCHGNTPWGSVPGYVVAYN